MRTNIEIDDDLLSIAMRAGPFQTKREAVEAGLRLLGRQAAYKEILALKGKLRWEEAPLAAVPVAQEPASAYGAARRRPKAPKASG